MTKEELQARRAEKAIEEAEAMATTLIVDIHCNTDKRQAMLIAEELVQNYPLPGIEELKFLTDYLGFVRPDNEYKALLALRLSKVPNSVLLITYRKNVSDWVKTYTDKGITVYIYDGYTKLFYSPEEYLEHAKELVLDSIVQARHSADRPMLEHFAIRFGKAFGWSFSGPIQDRQLTPDALTNFLPFEITPYAGQSLYSFKDNIFESEVPTSRVTVAPTRKSILLSTQGVPLHELIDFSDFLVTVFDAGLEKECIEDGWTMCECENPVRTTGETPEDGYCSYCDRPIPGYQTTTERFIDTIKSDNKRK